MSESIIEIQRQTHEEIERLEHTLFMLLSRPCPTHKEHLSTEHTASGILDRIVSRTTTLHNTYHDSDGTRKTELDLLSTSSAPGQDDLTEFYVRLGKIKDHHQKYPDQPISDFEDEYARFLSDPNVEEYVDDFEEDPISLLFSGEEAYGRYVDLYASHTQYNNLKHIGKRLGYLQYLDILLAAQQGPLHLELSKEARYTREYEIYLTNLHKYLLSFLKRTQPLVDLEKQESVATEEFDAIWENGPLTGWEDAASAKTDVNGNMQGIWCAACQKNYAKQTVYDAHLTSKKHIKASARQATHPPPPPNPNGPLTGAVPMPNSSQPPQPKHRQPALLSHLIASLVKTLAPTLTETKSNVERRFSLTSRERELELLDDNPGAAPAPVDASAGAPPVEEEQEEERIYNPLKLPLGWDGKPIPYWLYKLHGLGVEYRCEICSDHVYMGRKNFDRHFQESRHAFGMRALGLPNTKHFHEITRIDDALSLAERLKQEGRREIFQMETMEELEDDEGNVYNKKTYDDLKKQGLI